eukprot:6885-Heterococcus_DN1.PRE.1
MVLARPPKMCNFIEWRDKKIVYKRYFGNVCELDIIFNFHKSTTSFDQIMCMAARMHSASRFGVKWGG